jgi:ornithine cyclodeaminase
MQLRILAERDCRAVLDMRAAIGLQRRAFALVADERALGGLRSVASGTTPPSVTIFNPCFLTGGGGFGIKVVSDFYENEKLGKTRMTATVSLFDGATGHPTTLMEAGYLTDMRTGAGTGLAAELLARPDSRVVTLIGAGRVARNQLEALAEVFPLERVNVCTRSRERGERFVATLAGAGRIPRDVRLVDDRERAVAEADIVVAATTSRTPVVEGRWLRPGTFVASAGAYAPTSREVDGETVVRADLRVIDSVRDSLDRAGDFVLPMNEGAIARESVLDLAELVAGRRPGRTDARQIAYYKSCGVAVQDLVTAQFIAEAAAARGLGTVVDIGGEGEAT